MADKFKLKRLDTQLNYLTNQNSINFHKRVQPMNKKTVLLTLRTRVINSLMSLPSLRFLKTVSYIFFDYVRKLFSLSFCYLLKFVYLFNFITINKQLIFMAIDW